MPSRASAPFAAKHGQRVPRKATSRPWWLLGSAAAVTFLATSLARPTALAARAGDTGAVVPSVTAPTATPAAEPPLPRDAASPPATAAAEPLPPGPVLVQVVDAAERPVADVEVLAIAHDGRALPERLLTSAVIRALSDAKGFARFTLPAGRHDLAQAGTTSREQVQVGPGENQVRLRVPAPQTLRGRVVDGDGQPIADAEIVVSETALRGDAGAVVARSRPDGSFLATVRQTTGRVFARHPDHADGVGTRLEANVPLRLVLPWAERSIAVQVNDAGGRPLAGAYVALVPRSLAMSFYPPQHACTDTGGRALFTDPGPGEASLIASAWGLAPTIADLPAAATHLQLVLAPGAALRGQVLGADGNPLAGVVVSSSVADQRSNEPVAPLIARETRSAADGAFDFAHLPAGMVQVRVNGTPPRAPGLLPYPRVLAAADVELVAGQTTRVVLRVLPQPAVRGRLVTPAGQPVAGWNVLASPRLGTAFHRLFRGRGAPTDAEGGFQIADLAADEDYQLAVFPPGAPHGQPGSFPFVCGEARPGGEPVQLVVDPSTPPSGRLRCRVLRPNGQPCVGAQFELRTRRYEVPQVRSAGEDGSGEFAGLAAGAYWLAIIAPGLGTQTLAVTMPDEPADVDLGTMTLQLGARLHVHPHAVGGAAPGRLRVVARSILGDKFVTGDTDARGLATMPVLPPGPTTLLVHGPGIAPLVHRLELVPGAQSLDLEVSPAPTVPIVATFPLADNPFTVNGPLHVQFWRDGELVFEDFVAACSARGQFDLTTGLPQGSWRVVARALWNARAEVQFTVGATAPEPVTLRLQR